MSRATTRPTLCGAVSVACLALWPALTAGLRAQVVIDPTALLNLRASLCFVETFDGTNAARYGTSVPGFFGQAVSTETAAHGPTFPRAVVNPAAGTIAWWARYDFAALKMVPVLVFDNGLYINFFGKEGSTDPRHSNCLGHYWNLLGGPVFASYTEGIPSNRWMHFAFTWNGDQTTFYVNGNVSSVQTTTKPFSALPFTAFTLGGAGRYVFDELRVHNRALTQAELRACIAAARSEGDEVRRMALGVPERLASSKAASVRAAYRLSDHAVQVYSDLGAFGVSNRADVLVTVRRADASPVAKRTYTDVEPQTLFHASLPMEKPLPDGVYTVEVKVNGQTATAVFERVREVWEDNRIGVTNGVMTPWTPVTTRRDAAVCWGREYTFGTLGLPAQIRSTQPEPSRGPVTRDLLAQPVRLVVETAAGELAWRKGRTRVRRRDDTAAEVAAEAVTEDKAFAATLDGTLEFDGFYKFTLSLRGLTNTALQSVRLEVALPDAIARLAHAAAEDMRASKAFVDLAGEADGVLWDSLRSGHRRKLPGNFYPSIWFGDEDRGIAYLADGYRGWALDPRKPCQDIVRTNGQTVLRLHLLNQPGALSGPLGATLSLQATPVRPRPPGGSWKAVDWYGWGYFDKAVLYHGCFDGIGTNGLAPEAWYRTEAARRDNRWWRYFCFQSFRTPFDDPDYGRVVQRYADEWEGGLHVPSHRDFLLWAYRQWHDRASMDGVYYDNSYPQMTRGLGTGLAWKDEQGTVQPSYNNFGSREFMKRVRAYFLSQGPAPVLKAHITDAAIPGYLGFCDFWMDGENGGYLTAEQEAKAAPDGQHIYDFVDRWYSRTGMANLRVTLGRMWGVMPQYLYVWQPDPTQAVLGLFDIDQTYWRMNGLTNAFGLTQADCDFIAYWDVRKPVAVTQGGPDVFTAVWKRPGRARVQVSNLSPQDRRVEARLDLAALGLPADTVAMDEQGGAAVALDGGRLRGLAVPRHGYRVVVAAAPGVFPPAPELAAALRPLQRIAALCDDFATLSKAWQPRGRDGDWLDLWPGALRLSGAEGVTVCRPFGEDHCSVQVRIQAHGGFWDGGPSLLLSWGQDTYAQIVAGNLYPMPWGPRIRASAVAGGKAVPLPPGPAAGAATWVRIALKPEGIGFLCTTDGRAWTTLGSVPRAGFEGAPALLILGLPMPGANAFHTGQGRGQGAAFFADLITARE